MRFLIILILFSSCHIQGDFRNKVIQEDYPTVKRIYYDTKKDQFVVQYYPNLFTPEKDRIIELLKKDMSDCYMPNVRFEEKVMMAEKH